MYPAGEPGVSVQYITLDDGLRVRVVESGPATDDAVLLVHGWGGSVYSFAEMIPALAAAGHRAIAMDLPGHGLSDKPVDDGRYSTEALSDCVLSVADAMGVRRFALVGHSMGASLALEIGTRLASGAANSARRLERMVLINPVGLGRVPLIGPAKILSPRVVDRIVPSLLTRRMISGILRLAFGTQLRPTDRDIDEYWAPTQFAEFAWACRACVHSATWGRVAATRLRSLRLPVLVLTGGRDKFVRGAAQRAKLIPAVRVVTIHEGGHLVMQECTVKAHSALLPFLRGERSRE
ncbi:MAG TPA: alpha/beta fold hydrolase [Gemmatimonadaceae bacterium]|nr:alpha/beta fold hydrolase [Gemmatimonadaceae bacterium]